MTTLYRPVLIESAEQADALPAGALLHRARGNLQTGLVGMVLRSPYTDRSYYRVGVDHWPVRRVVETFAEALVPIEAEEEHATNRINITHMSPPAPQQVPVLLPCPRCGLR